MDNKKIFIIVGIVTLVVFLIASILYIPYMSNGPAAEYKTDPITGENYLHNAKTSDGSESIGTVITDLSLLSGRGLSLEQVDYFKTHFIKFIDNSSYSHDEILRIKPDTLNRDLKDKHIETSFDIYLNDNDYLSATLINKYSQLDTVSIVIKDRDNKEVYKQSAD